MDQLPFNHILRANHVPFSYGYVPVPIRICDSDWWHAAQRVLPHTLWDSLQFTLTPPLNVLLSSTTIPAHHPLRRLPSQSDRPAHQLLPPSSLSLRKRAPQPPPPPLPSLQPPSRPVPLHPTMPSNAQHTRHRPHSDRRPSHRPPHPPSSHRTSTNPTTNTTSTAPSTSTSKRPRGYPKPLGRGRGFPVLCDGRYLTSHPTTLLLHPSATSWVMRHPHSARLFTLTRPHSLLSRDRVLLDARTARPVLRARSSLFSARSTTRLHAQGASLLTVHRKSPLEPRTFHAFLNSGTRPDLVIRTDAKGRRFTFTDRRSIDVATVKKRTIRGSGGEKKVEYRMHLSPGYDAALFVTALVCVQEALCD